MDPAAEARRVGAELAELAHRSGTPIYELSKDLRRHPNYLSRAFGGDLELKVWDVFAVLRELRARPREFWTWLYPFGEELAFGLEKAETGLPPRDSTLHTMLRRAEEEQDHHLRTPDEWTLRVREQLRDVLRRKKKHQAVVSQALGLGEKALGGVLQGKTQLTLIHLFGVLEQTGTIPGRFFVELFGNPEGEPFAIQRWVRMLDAAETKIATPLTGLAVEKGFPVPEPKTPKA